MRQHCALPSINPFDREHIPAMLTATDFAVEARGGGLSRYFGLCVARSLTEGRRSLIALAIAGLSVSSFLNLRSDALAEDWPTASSADGPSDTVDPFANFISEASRRFNVPESVIRAVMNVESAIDVHAVSPKGAVGLMQIMPQTWWN